MRTGLFDNIPLSRQQEDRVLDIRLAAQKFSGALGDATKPSREQSLAVTKLEETVMWAIKAISREEAE